MSNNKSIKKNTVLNTFRMALTVLVPLITFPYISRIFLTDGNGKLNFANSVVQILTIIASLGIYTYGVREGTKVRDNKEDFTKLAIELFSINLASTVITYIVLIFLILIHPFNQYRELLLIYGITIGFTALGLDWVYGTYEEYKYITIRQILVQLFTIILMFLFVHEKEDIYIWALISTISSVGANIFNFIYARKYICFSYIRNAMKSICLKKHIIPVLVLFATQLASKVYSNLDTILLGTLTSDHNTGLYSAAVKVNNIVITCFIAMMPVFIPRIVSYLKANDIVNYNNFINKIFKIIIALSLPLVIGIEILSPEIIRILAGEEFIDAALTMRILSPIILISSINNIFYYNIFVPMDKEKNVLICTLVSTLINLIISIILIPALKENGAALGSLIAEFCAFMVAISLYHRESGEKKCKAVGIFNYIIGSIIILIYCIVIKNNIGNIFVSVMVCVIGSIFIYYFYLVFRHDEVGNEISSFIKNNIKKRSAKEK